MTTLPPSLVGVVKGIVVSLISFSLDVVKRHCEDAVDDASLKPEFVFEPLPFGHDSEPNACTRRALVFVLI